MKVRLNHYSHLKGAEGTPGDVVTVSDEIGQAWCDDGAAVCVDEPKPAAKPKASEEEPDEKKPAAKPKASEEEPDEKKPAKKAKE